MWTDFKQPQYLRDYQRKKPIQESEKGEPEILGKKKNPEVSGSQVWVVSTVKRIDGIYEVLKISVGLVNSDIIGCP